MAKDFSEYVPVALGLGLFALGRGDDGDNGGDTPTNKQPTANVSASADGLSISASASGSSDPDGQIVSYTWEISNSNGDVVKTGSGVDYATTVNVPGSYTVAVTVTDDKGASATATTGVTTESNIAVQATDLYFNSGNLVAEASISGAVSMTKYVLYDDGSVIDDSGWLSGSVGQYSVSASRDGSVFRAEVSVRDAAGNVVTDSMELDTPDPNQAPGASFDVSTDGLSVSATSTASDPDGSITSYSWVLEGPDGRVDSSTGPDYSYTASGGGTYTLSHTVSDDDGATDSSLQSFDLVPPVNMSVTVTSVYMSGSTLVVESTASGDFTESRIIAEEQVNGTWEQVYDTGWFGGHYGNYGQNTSVSGPIAGVVRLRDQYGREVSDRLENFRDGGSGYENTLEISVPNRVFDSDVYVFAEATEEMEDGEINTSLGPYEQPIERGYNGDIQTLDWAAGPITVRINGEKVDPYDLSGDLGTRRQWLDGDGSEVVEICVFLSEQQYQNYGFTPAVNAAEWLSESFKDAGLSHDILYGLPPVTVPTQSAGCSTDKPTPDSLYWFTDLLYGSQVVDGATGTVEGDPFVKRKDSNVLLTDTTGGGCGHVGGKTCVAGVNNIGSSIDYNREPSDSKPVYDLQTIMHEVAHNLGYAHPQGTCDEAGGRVWNGSNDPNLLDGYFYSTPAVPKYSELPCENRCGESMPARQDPTLMVVPWWTTCDIEIFRASSGGMRGNDSGVQGVMSGSLSGDCGHCAGTWFDAETAQKGSCGCNDDCC